jgi:hypothetical protein
VDLKRLGSAGAEVTECREVMSPYLAQNIFVLYYLKKNKKGQCFFDDFEALVREIYVRG